MAGINLKEMEKNSWQYSMQDGLVEVFLGILLVTAGILLSMDLSFGVFPVLFIIFANPVMEAVRKRFTYPRIGRVKVHVDEPKKTVSGIFLYMLAVAVIMAAAMLVFFGEISAELIYRSLPIFFSVMILGAMLYSHGKTGSRRFIIYAVIALVSAPAFSILEFETRLAGLGYYLLFLGGLFVLIGLAIFASFLARHPLNREVRGHGKG